jgi:Ca2+/Na+ antiporter
MNNNLDTTARVILEVLKEIARKIKDEVLLLAFVYSLIVVLVVVVTRRFPEWVGITLVCLYLIAVTYKLGALCLDDKKRKKS